MTYLHFNNEKAVRHMVFNLISEHIPFSVKFYSRNNVPYWEVDYDEPNLKFDDEQI